MGVNTQKCIDKSVKCYTSNDVKCDDKSFLIIYKNHGKFYQCKNIDAYIMNTLFGYKVLKGDVSGFPDTSINKVINTLEDAKISYQIIDVDKDPIIKDFGKINTYSKYLDMSFKNLDKKKKVDFLIDKLKELSIKLLYFINKVNNENNYKNVSIYKVEINSFISVIDYTLERIFIKHYISESKLKKVTYKLSEINKMCNK